ncbi:TetR/AcrR family transcriptional regulator [Companilactobacillus bobalius]|uniref:HTH tetR-type domain-containing protein n=2 Tax=Companilactobacillus bobalius TaxID=2801451 RepID=A0A202FFD9_9LACO|nr:TetR/AcrR family transcriptional regulator [Companilactobacillus bobalius]KAE9560378.1 hypothetical protein ATN92_09430 [Companilactobacillus bobalius]KRK83125.1 hypothetical protein FC78_GL001934 [Companilactobacillus bobalius DSM 19674]OVE99186.1 hypothetical protein LKACC16343_00298 [Companilactobacillus bobalius]GEO57162.1 hypothetical protein LBO01_02910 [Companilactobacillus paralimentarius]
MGKREDNAIAIKNRLLETTDNLIQKYGYQNVSVADITKASGIAKGTFYNYYKKKNDIINDLGKKHFSEINQKIDTLAHDHSAVESIGYYLKQYVNIITRVGVIRVKTWIQFIIIPNDDKTKLDYDLLSLVKLIQGLVNNNKLSPNTPVKHLADFILTYVNGVIFSWTVNEQKDPDKIIHDFCELELVSLLKPYQK